MKIARSFALRPLIASALLVMVCAPGLAAAQGTDASRARDLASRGRAAYDRGDFAAGCPLLDDAYRLDGTLLGAGFALAECREKEGKLATAHRTFLEIASKAEARGEDRAVEAKARAASLEPRLPRLRVDVSEAAAKAIELTVTVDGQPWPRAAWGVAEPLDRGAHEVAATAPGETAWSTRVEATDGETVDATVPFGRAAATPVASRSPTTLPDEAAERGSVFPWATAGLVTAGVGVGCVGLGVVLGLVAKGSYDGASGCDASNTCTPAGARERNDARGLANVGTAFFIVGGVLAAGGVTVFLLAPGDGDAASAAVRVHPGGVTLDGKF